VAGGMDKVPEVARRHGMTVSLGIWLKPDLVKNEAEIVNRHPHRAGNRSDYRSRHCRQ